MDAPLTDLKAYLHEVLDANVATQPWLAGERLPVYFNNRYKVFEARIFDTGCLIMAARDDDEPAPTDLARNIQFLEHRTGRPCIFVAPAVTPITRKRLIAKGVQFVVPHNQMYLPRLGVDLRERFKRRKELRRQHLAPAAQAALIHYLLHGHGEALNPTLLATRLRYTLMTMTRVVDEFVAAQLGRAQERGRERWFTFHAQKRDLWNLALPLLRTPVKRRFHAIKTTNNTHAGLNAGLTALAHRTLLAEPGTETRAVTPAEARGIEGTRGRHDFADRGPDVLEFEVWAYDPRPLIVTPGADVDPLSLYLSLKDHPDERVEAAAGELIRAHAW